MDKSNLPNANTALAEGPGAVPAVAEREKPLLDGLDENFYVEIMNPLPVRFIAKVAATRPQRMPALIMSNKNTPTVTKTEEDVMRNYGLGGFVNPDHPSNTHITQSIEIGAGQTIRLPGNEAQVVIKQLVNLIMDKREQPLLKGDSFARRKVEEEIVIHQGTMSEFFTQRTVDMHKVLNRDIEQPHATEEQSFPSETIAVGRVGQADSGSASDPGATSKRSSNGQFQKK